MADNADRAQAWIQAQTPSEPSDTSYYRYLVAYFDETGEVKVEEVCGIDHFSLRSKHLIFGEPTRYAETCLSAHDGVIETQSDELRSALMQHLGC